MIGWHIIKVSGESMAPVLSDKDYILIKKPRRLVLGQLYVVEHADLGRIVKRLTGRRDERYEFEGINPASSPASIIGAVERHRVTGQVILIIGKAGVRRP